MYLQIYLYEFVNILILFVVKSENNKWAFHEYVPVGLFVCLNN